VLFALVLGKFGFGLLPMRKSVAQVPFVALGSVLRRPGAPSSTMVHWSFVLSTEAQPSLVPSQGARYERTGPVWMRGYPCQ